MIRWGRLTGFVLIILLLSLLMASTTNDIVKNITLGLDLQGGFEVLYQAIPTAGQEITRENMKDAAAALERRVGVLGVAEPRVEIEGTDRIRVQLAGVPDQNKARDLLGKPAKLTFRDPNNKILLNGDDLVPGAAKVDLDQIGRPIVALELKDPQKFADITREYVGQPIGIYLDEDRITNPVVNDIITGGIATITGQETTEEAQELADLLNAGALPVDLTEIQSQSVGASLGMKALELAVKAGIIGAIAVLLFMIIFYRAPGLIAGFSLIAYVYLLLVIFKELHVTLTLQGIAALILGIGMAVDANIITYERIKEELRSGKSLLSAIRSGSKRSLATILDANITTIIAALVIFMFGTSSIKGFATTLIISITVSMFTAVFGSRLLLNLFVRSNVLTNPWAYGVKEEEIGEL